MPRDIKAGIMRQLKSVNDPHPGVMDAPQGCSVFGCTKDGQWMPVLTFLPVGWETRSDAKRAEFHIGISFCDEHKDTDRALRFLSRTYNPKGVAQLEKMLRDENKPLADLNTLVCQWREV
jgi:hypothetical protein